MHCDCTVCNANVDWEVNCLTGGQLASDGNSRYQQDSMQKFTDELTNSYKSCGWAVRRATV